MVVGAVPGVAPELAVPPEIASPSLADQTVSMINCVPEPAVRAEC